MRTYIKVLLLLLCALFLSGLRLSAEPTRYSTAPRAVVHVLSVFDTRANQIGALIERTDRVVFLDALAKAFKKAGREDQLDLLPPLTGDEANPANIIKALEGLVGKTQHRTDDAVLFYYSGHGAMDPSEGHYLALSSGDILRKRIRDLLLQMPVRLRLILTDSCGSYIFSDRGQRFAFETAMRFEEKFQLIQNLFFESRGIVDINSAAPGTVSKITPDIGGYWTYAFCSLLTADHNEIFLRGGKITLDVNHDGRVSWDEFIPAVDQGVAISQWGLPAKDKQRSHAFEIAVSLMSPDIHGHEGLRLFQHRKVVLRNRTSSTINVSVAVCAKSRCVHPDGREHDTYPFLNNGVYYRQVLEPGEVKLATAEGQKIQAQAVRFFITDPVTHRSFFPGGKEQVFDVSGDGRGNGFYYAAEMQTVTFDIFWPTQAH